MSVFVHATETEQTKLSLLFYLAKVLTKSKLHPQIKHVLKFQPSLIELPNTKLSIST